FPNKPGHAPPPCGWVARWPRTEGPSAAIAVLVQRVENALRRLTIERALPALDDVVLGHRDRGRDGESRRLLADQAIGTHGRHGAAELIGLVGGDGRDIAALDHVETDRLGQVER